MRLSEMTTGELALELAAIARATRGSSRDYVERAIRSRIDVDMDASQWLARIVAAAETPGSAPRVQAPMRGGVDDD